MEMSGFILEISFSGLLPFASCLNGFRQNLKMIKIWNYHLGILQNTKKFYLKNAESKLLCW